MGHPRLVLQEGFLKMRESAILIQKTFRAYNGRRKYAQMRTGYMRMQALIRSRILSHKFRHLRGHIVRLQARCPGCLVRRSYEKKLWAVIKIQSHVRKMIAMRHYRKLKIEYRAKSEALRLREMEQRELERKYGKKKAKEVAEQNFQE